jgi:hypothetical protein
VKLRYARRLLIAMAYILSPFACLAFPAPALAVPDAGLAFSRLTYVCPNPMQIDFSWTPVNNALFYSLQLAGPIDPALNGAVAGTYLRPFGTIEVTKGQALSASVTLNPASAATPLSLQWQVVLGAPTGYVGLVPRMQVAIIPVPCGQTTPLDSPLF